MGVRTSDPYPSVLREIVYDGIGHGSDGQAGKNDSCEDRPQIGVRSESVLDVQHRPVEFVEGKESIGALELLSESVETPYGRRVDVVVARAQFVAGIGGVTFRPFAGVVLVGIIAIVVRHNQ